MKPINHLFLLVFFVLVACQNRKDILPDPDPLSPINSFTVKAINSRELHNIVWTNNDSLIISYVQPVRRRYTRSGTIYSRIQEQEIKTDTDDGIMCTWIGKDGSLTLAGDKKIIYRTDSSGKLLFKSYLPDKIPGLDSNYLIIASRFYEMEIRNDTIISRIGSKGPAEVTIQYCIKAPNEVMFRLIPGDTAIYLSQYLPKPTASKTIYPVPGWNYKVLANGVTYLLYSQIDTIYKKESNDLVTHIPLHNRAFTPSPPFNVRRYADVGYRNLYGVSYFNYDGLVFNKHSGHFIAFYRLPLQSPDAAELLTYNDQVLHATVFNENFKPVKYVSLPRHTYYALYYNVENGIAIPREDKKTEDEKGEITFDIYDL